MRIDYLPLPKDEQAIPRPVVDVQMEGIPEVGITCLVDSGALHNRFDERLAELAGLTLVDAEIAPPFSVAGKTYTGRWINVTLTIGEFSWDAPVCFVENWQRDFQLLGQEGFFRWFQVCFSAADEYFTIELARH